MGNYTKTMDFFKDIRQWVKAIPESDKILNQYTRGLITLDETYKALYDKDLENIVRDIKMPGKMKFEDIKVGSNFMWIVNDPDSHYESFCTVTEVSDDSFIAWCNDIEHTIMICKDFMDDIRELTYIEQKQYLHG